MPSTRVEALNSCAVISHHECSQSEVETRCFSGHGPLLCILWEFDGKDYPVVPDRIIANGYCLYRSFDRTTLTEVVDAFADLDVPLTSWFPSSLFQGEGTVLDRLPDRKRGDTSGASTRLPFCDVFEEPFESTFYAFNGVLHRLRAETLPVRAKIVTHEAIRFFRRPTERCFPHCGSTACVGLCSGYRSWTRQCAVCSDVCFCLHYKVGLPYHCLLNRTVDGKKPTLRDKHLGEYLVNRFSRPINGLYPLPEGRGYAAS